MERVFKAYRVFPIFVKLWCVERSVFDPMVPDFAIFMLFVIRMCPRRAMMLRRQGGSSGSLHFPRELLRTGSALRVGSFAREALAGEERWHKGKGVRGERGTRLSTWGHPRLFQAPAPFQATVYLRYLSIIFPSASKGVLKSTNNRHFFLTPPRSRV
jgi:hypothetical protein